MTTDDHHQKYKINKIQFIILASYLATKNIKMFWGHIHKNLEEDKNIGFRS